MARTPLPCFKCGKHLESAFKDMEGAHQPWGATMFEAGGNYGSTVFDPMAIRVRKELQINICDECLVENKAAVWYSERVPQPQREIVSEPWEPDLDAEEDDDDG